MKSKYVLLEIVALSLISCVSYEPLSVPIIECKPYTFKRDQANSKEAQVRIIVEPEPLSGNPLKGYDPKYQARFDVEFHVDKNGDVTHARIFEKYLRDADNQCAYLETINAEMEKNIVEAAYLWKFWPAIRDDTPVETVTLQTFVIENFERR